MYLSVLTFLFGVILVAGKWVIEQLVPPSNLFDWMLIVVFAVMVFVALLAWLTVFRAAAGNPVPQQTPDGNYIAYLRSTQKGEIYEQLTDQVSRASELTSAVNLKVVRLLESGVLLIRLSIFLLIVFAGITIWSLWGNQAERKSGQVEFTLEGQTRKPKGGAFRAEIRIMPPKKPLQSLPK